VTDRTNDPVTNAISFDLEHWHSATLLQPEVTNPEDCIKDSVNTVLDLLRRNSVRATFFIVGEVADEYPSLIKTIRDAGHEIASHGHTHTPLFHLTPDRFKEELSRSAEAIERAAGVEPSGFRAPNFSITPRTAWAFRALESSSFRYDSSVFPLKTPMYGVSDAPLRPYYVERDDPFTASSADRSAGGLVEFPLSTTDTKVRFPIAGGFYARVLPVWLLKRGIRHLNGRDIPANLYFHPWEFNPEVRFEDCPAHKRFVSFHNIEHTEDKLERLFTSFEFGTVAEVLNRRSLLDAHDDSSPNHVSTA